MPTTANIVQISTTLPPQVTYRSASSANCDASKLPVLTCTMFSVSEPSSFQVMVKTNAPFQGSYTVTWTAKMLANDAGDLQRDLLAANNTASITSEVRIPQAPNKLFLPLLGK
jgi:hypothetical protein